MIGQAKLAPFLSEKKNKRKNEYKSENKAGQKERNVKTNSVQLIFAAKRGSSSTLSSTGIVENN